MGCQVSSCLSDTITFARGLGECFCVTTNKPHEYLIRNLSLFALAAWWPGDLVAWWPALLHTRRISTVPEVRRDMLLPASVPLCPCRITESIARWQVARRFPKLTPCQGPRDSDCVGEGQQAMRVEVEVFQVMTTPSVNRHIQPRSSPRGLRFTCKFITAVK